ncbi:D-alanyl-D-alanine carboxypeptidase/D-alanyl-D-alanine-endopeptidase [Chryseolinea lacunae]|uniref:D-alanyl-D-alanine carboxypeptidase n=1 Tax=Chryseolinea lacunae TaxID=2801331 RepID=A0ABS1KR99_9BACT|nr:D-alanyl-D-alanine carboxypeptidase [Chryseolinea lacunae]MBL0741747.1 D-alanyl-D-alanine carboxypeptidase [Chryseolinea lacunae]
MRKFWWLAFVFCSELFFSCSPIAPRKLNKMLRATEAKFQDHTGFMLYDLQDKKTIYAYNEAKYFTPASNTKIFTFFTALNVLGDSLPGLRYVEHGDSLIFWGTGDPTFLYKNVFNNGRIFSFLASRTAKLYFSASNYNTTAFGPGWAWDDFNSSYSPERSPFPIYGNIASLVAQGDKAAIAPRFFRNNVNVGQPEANPRLTRKPENNDFTFYPANSKKFVDDIPFHVDADIATQLLADTLKRSVKRIDKSLSKDAKTIYNMPVDSAYRVMMQESDNFIAEQLLLMSAGVLSDSLQPEIAIRHMKKNLLNDLPDVPEWVDGSGLSRYNLFTPRSVVKLWEKIYARVPRERLFPLLVTGGKPGTLRNWYKADKPYVFGKTGSLSNNHCLSGFLVTKRGKTVVFSFMNSNYTVASNEIRKNMQTLLNLIYENY